MKAGFRYIKTMIIGLYRENCVLQKVIFARNEVQYYLLVLLFKYSSPVLLKALMQSIVGVGHALKDYTHS